MQHTLMFYLTYRPQTIDAVDNSKVRDVIKKYLAAKSIPHAWLFTGHKGMGKTSVARILAKELCKTGDAQKDAIIVADIENGTSADVQEINGADNTGIDDVRKLIENISYAPMVAKFRMYIIDEVHMLSTSAFNGLLKILEEPPEHAIFILATTSLDKIPSTIQSRCVKVDFGTAAPSDVVAMIDRIATAEKLTIADETKDLIAAHCDRSFRDATKILEELVTQNALAPEEARRYLGLRTKGDVLVHIAKKDAIACISWLQEYAAGGGDVKLQIEELIRKVHALILMSHGIAADYPVDPQPMTIAELTKLQRLLHEAYTVSRQSPVPSAALQIAFIEYCHSK